MRVVTCRLHPFSAKDICEYGRHLSPPVASHTNCRLWHSSGTATTMNHRSTKALPSPSCAVSSLATYRNRLPFLHQIPHIRCAFNNRTASSSFVLSFSCLFSLSPTCSIASRRIFRDSTKFVKGNPGASSLRLRTRRLKNIRPHCPSSMPFLTVLASRTLHLFWSICRFSCACLSGGAPTCYRLRLKNGKERTGTGHYVTAGVVSSRLLIQLLRDSRSFAVHGGLEFTLVR